MAASKAKYPQYYPSEGSPPFSPFRALHPTVGYAWTLENFPNRSTRWTFPRQSPVSSDTDLRDD